MRISEQFLKLVSFFLKASRDCSLAVNIKNDGEQMCQAYKENATETHIHIPLYLFN